MATPNADRPHTRNMPPRLIWTGGAFAREAVWPKEPDVEIIKEIAESHLRPTYLPEVDDALLRVEFYAQGGFNKLYRISHVDHAKSYIFRVSLPLDPFFKVESEVATLAYVRANTTIPVAQVIAWDSNWDTELGFEWILTEMIDGITLYDVWREIPWERKLQLTDDVAKMVAQLRKQPFDSIGSLYYESALRSLAFERTDPTRKGEIQRSQPPFSTFAKAKEAAPKAPEISTPTSLLHLASTRLEAKERGLSTVLCRQWDEGMSTTGQTNESQNTEVPDMESENIEPIKLAVGQMHDVLFFMEDRLELETYRGPFRNAREWLNALIDVQLKWIDRMIYLVKNVGGKECRGYETLPKEALHVRGLCQKYKELLPEIFRDEKASTEFVLYHHDLNAANILVHPETYDIVGILDWEMTCIVPQWKAACEPKFLQDGEFPWETEEPPIPLSYDMEKYQFPIEKRDRWDFKQLRLRFNSTMQKLMEGYDPESDPQVITTKRDVESMISEFSENWETTERWLERYRNNVKAPPDSAASGNDNKPSENPEAGGDESKVEA